jgi:hypothetical protein
MFGHGYRWIRVSGEDWEIAVWAGAVVSGGRDKLFLLGRAGHNEPLEHHNGFIYVPFYRSWWDRLLRTWGIRKIPITLGPFIREPWDTDKLLPYTYWGPCELEGSDRALFESLPSDQLKAPRATESFGAVCERVHQSINKALGPEQPSTSPSVRVLDGPAQFEGAICRTVAVDGKVRSEIWIGSAWVPGGENTDAFFGRPLSPEELVKAGIK